MKKMILFVAILTLVAFVGIAMAQQTTAPAPTTASAPQKAKVEKPKTTPKTQTFIGTVQSVDETGKTIVAKNAKGEKTFSISDAEITKGGKVMPLSELKEGTHVAIQYKDEVGTMIASSVKAAVSKGGPAKATLQRSSVKTTEEPDEPATK